MHIKLVVQTKKPVKSKRRWEDNIKMYLIETEGTPNTAASYSEVPRSDLGPKIGYPD
jgi:hypothetical protein